MNHSNRPRNRALNLITIIILLLSAGLRFYHLNGLPPGLHFDEAANAIITRNIAQEDYFPIFINDFTGKEVLWFYLSSLLVKTMGSYVFTLRMASSLTGVVTVALTGWMVRQVYRDDPRRDGLALLSMALLAVSFWQIVIGRLAFRAISQPLMQALSLGLLWKALDAQRRTLLWHFLAGFALGLSAYTYLAVRLFPIPLAIALALLIICDKDRIVRLPGLAIYGLGAVISFGPLGLFFWRNPERFFTRVEQVSAGSQLEVMEGWRRAFGMFFLSGDPLLRFTLPGKPLFDLVLGAFLIIGFIVAVRDGFKTDVASKRAWSALLIVWPVVMLAPTALAVNGIVPSNLRAVGLAPVIFLYPALGIQAVIGWIKSILKPERMPHPERSITLLVLLIYAGLIRSDLDTWGSQTNLYYDYDGHIRALGEAINANGYDPESLYINTSYFKHPTILFTSENGALAPSLFGGNALVLSPDGTALIAFTRDSLPPESWGEILQDSLILAPEGPDGTPDFYLYELDETLPIWPEETLSINFGNIITLTGVTLYPAESGEVAEVDLRWRVTGAPDQTDYRFVAEVCDQWGWCWVKTYLDGSIERGDNRSYLSDNWRVGEQVLTRLAIPLPEGIPPGTYSVQVQVVSDNGGSGLSIVSDSGGFAGFTGAVEGLEITPTAHVDLSGVPIQYRADQEINDAIRLIGYDLPHIEGRAGESLSLALYWQKDSDSADDDQVTLSLDDGTILSQGNPVHDSYPASEWLEGSLVVDRYSLTLPPDLASGMYALSVQLGDSDPISLGELIIEQTDRRFDLPDSMTPVDTVVFGEQIRLAGFTLPEKASPGVVYPVELIWQAESDMSEAYQVFVHFVPEGEIIPVTQFDRTHFVEGVPYPTDLWVPGEVIIDDPYLLALPDNLPPGTYLVRVGVYLLGNGQRLALPGSSDDAFELPVEVIVK